MTFNRFHRAVVAVIATIALTVTSLAAQVGHSPFQATPVAGDAAGWQVAEVTPLEIDGVAVSLSPDGTTIAGLDAEGAICFWTVAGLEQACAEPSVEGPPIRIDPDSIAWAPDSSAVAYSTHAYRYGTDSDIYVVDVESTTTHNITDDGIEKANLFDDSESTPIDVMPAWSPDGVSIVFSRTVFDDREELSNEIMRVSRDGGDAETILSLPGLPASIFLPMRVLSDGSVIYTVAFSDQDEPTNGIWSVSPDGDATQLMPGNRGSPFPIPVINDTREGDEELLIVGHSVLNVTQFTGESPFSFVWSSATGEAVPIEAGIDETARVYAGALSPDGQTVLSLERSPAMMPVISLQGPETSVTDLPEFAAEVTQGRPIYVNATWSGANLVLISSFLTEGAYLVSVEPVPAT